MYNNVNRHLKILILGIVVLVAAFIFWAITATIVDTVSTEGFILPEKGVVLIPSEVEGKVKTVLVKSGSMVEKGQIIAVVEPEYLDESDFKTNYQNSAFISAPYKGIVTEIAVVGTYVYPETVAAMLIRQENYADNKQIICHVPSRTAASLEVGMPVQITPTHANREVYGFMFGTVSSVDTIISEDAGDRILLETLKSKSEETIDSVIVKITLEVDASSQNGMKWSNPMGKELMISLGNFCDVRIISKERHPIDFVFA